MNKKKSNYIDTIAGICYVRFTSCGCTKIVKCRLQTLRNLWKALVVWEFAKGALTEIHIIRKSRTIYNWQKVFGFMILYIGVWIFAGKNVHRNGNNRTGESWSSHASYIQKFKNAETTILGYEHTLFSSNVAVGTLSMHLVYSHRKFKTKRFFFIALIAS